MKKMLCTGLLVLALLQQSCTDSKSQSATSADTSATVAAADAPVMKFAETSYDFGSIQEGQVITHVFAFTNTGKTPLIIDRAFASCGCTVPDWPRTPVAPGESSEIKVEFNSRGKAGPQSKAITINANTQPRESVVTLVGIVNAPNQ